MLISPFLCLIFIAISFFLVIHICFVSVFFLSLVCCISSLSNLLGKDLIDVICLLILIGNLSVKLMETTTQKEESVYCT
jgi:hypothetical protein